MSAAIEAVELSKRYGRHGALSDVDLRVERGEVFGLIGPNGAGKTTCMRLLVDLLRPSGGTLRVLGRDPREGGKELRARTAYLPGELRLDGRARASDLLDYYASLANGVSRERTNELAERLGLDLSRRVGALSKGNRQKLGLVQAFMRDADLLILDEPTSGLDPVLQREFVQLVREAQAAGRTVFLSSHVLSEVQQVAGRVAILGRGRLLRVESVEELRASAPRRIRLSLPEGEFERGLAVLEELPGITSLWSEVQKGSGTRSLTARYAGAPRPLLDVIDALPITDLVVEEPNLEEAVMELYASEQPPGPGGREERT